MRKLLSMAIAAWLASFPAQANYSGASGDAVASGDTGASADTGASGDTGASADAGASGDTGVNSAWQAPAREAEAAFKRGELDEAEKQWKDALQKADQSRQVEPGMVNCLCGLAQVNEKRGNTLESERLYELAMRNMEGLVGRNDPRFADWLPDLAVIYQAHGRHDKAELLYQHALKIKEQAYGQNDLRVAQVLVLYARFLRQNGRDTEATVQETRVKKILARD